MFSGRLNLAGSAQVRWRRESPAAVRAQLGEESVPQRRLKLSLPKRSNSISLQLPKESGREAAGPSPVPAADDAQDQQQKLSWWQSLPARYKIVTAGSLSFVICNMVSRGTAPSICAGAPSLRPY
jgi:hypothetical protein